MTVTTLGDFEIHHLPDGSTVAYRDRDHSYYRETDGAKGKGRLTGISTVVAPFDWRPDNLMRWAARINCEGVAALAADGLSCDDADDMRALLAFLESGESITTALEDARLAYTDARDDAAGRGTNVHKHSLHALATGAKVPDRAAMTDEEWGYSQGVVKFWLDHEPRPISAEQVVFDPQLGVAGRLDLTCMLGGGERALIDCKTSGYLPVKHHVQLAGYDRTGHACGFPPTDAQYILQVTADGDYELVPSQATWTDFEVAVDLYRRAAAIGRQSNAARKAMAAGQQQRMAA